MSESGDRLLVAFVDALGPAQLESLATRLPWLTQRRGVDGVFGYSSGALATVLTGAPPMAHGRMCLFTQRPPEADSVLEPMRWLGLLPRVVHERGRLRRAAARWIAAREGLSGYVALHRVPPEAWRWLDLPERDDLFATESVEGVPTFLADARRAGLRVYAAPWQLSEKKRWEHGHAALARAAPDLAFLYCAELDAALHEGGPAAIGGFAALDRIASHLERARDEMERGGGRVTTILVGDHGMAEVGRAVDPRPVVRDLQTRFFVDSTMLRLWGDDRA
ncbi:MAG: alkaline phosphatase family protein, partial [Polyangiales bacterium]